MQRVKGQARLCDVGFRRRQVPNCGFDPAAMARPPPAVREANPTSQQR